MSQAISIKVEPRQTVRKGLANLRTEGWVPAVIHNHGQASILVQAQYVTLAKVYASAGKHHPVTVEVGGTKHLAMIKHADVEPTKQRLRHLVFQAIRQNEAVEANVPIVLSGEIPAEKASLMVISNIDTVQVQALPADLPDQLSVDASGLAEAGDKLTVADIKVPAGVTITTDPETMIATVEMPKDQIAEADAAAASLADDAGAAAEVPASEQAEPLPEGEAGSSEDKPAADQSESA